MPIPESAELVRIPCRHCPKEHFVWVHKETREALAHDGAGTPGSLRRILAEGI